MSLIDAIVTLVFREESVDLVAQPVLDGADQVVAGMMPERTWQKRYLRVNLRSGSEDP